MHADLSPTKRLHGLDGQPRMLLSEMVGNLATRTKPDGNALQNILERFVSGAKDEAAVSGRDVYEIISEKLSELNDYTGGYNFISVIKKYLEGYEAMVLKLLTWLMIRKYDSFFSENLYSFRPHYGAKHALRRLLDDPESSQYHSYKLDIRNYFNSIDVSMLLPILEGLLVDDKPLCKFLSGLLLDPRVIDEGNMVEEQKGAMAGMPFAVFLPNVFLTPLDRKFEQMPGVIYCRYSDDVVIFSKDKDILEAAKLSSGISTGNSTHPKATARSTGRGGTFR